MVFLFRILIPFRWLLLATLFAPARAEVGSSQEDSLPGFRGRFIHRMWETAEGILPTSVRSIAQTPDGYVWLASQDAVVRFDGSRAVNFSGRNTRPLQSPLRAQEVFAGRSGPLWCSTTDGKLYAFEADQWREFTATEGWEPAAVTAFSPAPDGKLLLVTGKKLVTFSNGIFSEIASPFKNSSDAAINAVFSRDGTLWAATSTELWHRDATEWKLTEKTATQSLTPPALAPSGLDGVWVAVPTELRNYSRTGRQTTLPRPADFRNDSLHLLEDSEGNLWAGGLESGLRVWMKDGTLLSTGTTSAILRPQITCLLEDRERNILVGTAGAGLARFKPANFHLALGEPGNLAGATINSVAAIAPGRVLAGTEGNGLFLIEDGTVTTQVLAKDQSLGPKQRVTSVLRLRDGRVIAAVASKGLCLIDGAEAVLIPSPPPVAKLVRSLFQDSDGTVWIGCETGVFSWKDAAFARLEAKDIPALTNVRGIAQEPSGTLWMLHENGLASLRGGVFVPFVNNALDKPLLSITIDSRGVKWVSVESKGLARIENDKVFLYSAEQGMPPASIGAIAADGTELWLATEKGLGRFPRTTLDAVAEGRSSRLQYRFFNRGDGLASDLFRRGYQPAFTREEDGRLWFASHKGAVAVRPSQISTPAFEVPAIIEEIRAERELIPITAANRGNVIIPAGTRHMTIRCSVPTLSKPEFMPIEYRLEGFDPRWYTTGSERVLRFYDLPPAKYRFTVRAIGADGKSVEPATSVSFTVVPLFWQTMWFRVGVVAAFAASAGFAVWRTMKFRLKVQEERLREQEERAALQSQLQQASQVEAIGRLAGGIAHDFNNVLTSILGNAELAHMEFGSNPKLAPLLNDILTAGGRARDLVVQILTYSRRRPASLAPLDLGSSVREALALLRSGIPATVIIETELPPELPPELPLVLADGPQIQRVVVNLCTNAAHALGPGGGRIQVRADDFSADAAFCARFPKLHPGRYVRIAVEDNGTGIDDNTLKHIFDPFFTTKGVGKGTGIGLAVVQGIVEGHNGAITVESRFSEGTTFTVYLPVTDTPSRAEPPSTKSITLAGNSERILVLDDEPAVLNVARRYLESLGYVVDEFTEPTAALDAFAKKPKRYHLIFTDFAMPGMNGVDFAQRIRGIRRDIPIILCTGFGGAVNEDAVRLVGITEVMNKPYQKETIAEAVANALRAQKGK